MFNFVSKKISDNKFTFAVAFCAIVKTLADNYWVFTDMPMAGDHGQKDDKALKAFYIFVQLLANTGIYGVLAQGIDRVLDQNPERMPLNP